MSTYLGSERPAGGMELKLWLFMRSSGILLLGLSLGHFFTMHVFNSIHVIDYDFVVRRYTGILWRGYDLLLLWLAMLHGMNGLRILLDDYVPLKWRQLSIRLLYVSTIGLVVLGTWVIIFFKAGA